VLALEELSIRSLSRLLITRPELTISITGQAINLTASLLRKPKMLMPKMIRLHLARKLMQEELLSLIQIFLVKDPRSETQDVKVMVLVV